MKSELAQMIKVWKIELARMLPENLSEIDEIMLKRMEREIIELNKAIKTEKESK